eukprot:6177514-Pleurochrysis_carterae.AAC.1
MRACTERVTHALVRYLTAAPRLHLALEQDVLEARLLLHVVYSRLELLIELVALLVRTWRRRGGGDGDDGGGDGCCEGGGGLVRKVVAVAVVVEVGGGDDYDAQPERCFEIQVIV